MSWYPLTNENTEIYTPPPQTFVILQFSLFQVIYTDTKQRISKATENKGLNQSRKLLKTVILQYIVNAWTEFIMQGLVLTKRTHDHEERLKIKIRK